MNKRGLILLVLFVISSLGVVAISKASTQSKVEVTIQYVPPSYVPQGHVWVDIDNRFISNNKIFGQNEKIYFAFYYDVAFISWAGGAWAYGDGWQPFYWFFDAPDENGTYTETRFCGTINVYLDEYDLGISNFDISDPSGADTYQQIRISLDIGWHYLTVVAAELVSDAKHTSFHWEYAKDQVVFYVGETDKSIPPILENSNAVCEVYTSPVNAENLGQHKYNWTDITVVHPVAEPAVGYYDKLYQTIDENGTAEARVIYNASWTPDIALEVGNYDVQFADIHHMGPGNYTWFVNDGDLNFDNATYTITQLPLRKGVNYVYFTLFGLKADDYSVAYGNPFPAMATSSVIYKITVGKPTTAVGPSFVAFISVSILSIAAVITLRRRK